MGDGMSTARLDDSIKAQLDEAERTMRCLAPAGDGFQARLARLARQGALARPYPGVYARPSYWNALEPKAQCLHVARTLSDAHPSWVFCATTAAVVHGMAMSYRYIKIPHISVPGKRCGQTRWAVWHHLRDDDDATIRLNGVRVTSFERTAFDCLRFLPFDQALAVADSALRIRNADIPWLMHSVCGYWPGYLNAQHARRVVHHANGLAENGGESMARAAMIELGYMLPELQAVVPNPLDGGTYRLDFLWRLADGRVVAGEYDGRGKYLNGHDGVLCEGDEALRGAVDKMAKERLRESRLTLAMGVMRFSPKQLRSRPYFCQLMDSFGIPRVREPQEIEARARIPRWTL